MKSLFESKKFMVAVLASILSMVGFYLELDMKQILAATGPLYAYIGAQGLSDFGKSAKPTIGLANFTNTPDPKPK